MLFQAFRHCFNEHSGGHRARLSRARSRSTQTPHDQASTSLVGSCLDPSLLFTYKKQPSLYALLPVALLRTTQRPLTGTRSLGAPSHIACRRYGEVWESLSDVNKRWVISEVSKPRSAHKVLLLLAVAASAGCCHCCWLLLLLYWLVLLVVVVAARYCWLLLLLLCLWLLMVLCWWMLLLLC